ncbi:hypothetical protein GCM10009837_64210 [Streptomyces durmitorensis]|uniref:TPM domain-containing protein n=1 Tax=Streptomyces durmitorensis TaxID=319947 RepID=A0ABY4PVT0_9ACTN|nr:hypothetical protein [Streptomyces durmitorensis]UQT57028.1 hypothetical protein M4V62_19035 [Streptomyces durmitorensis]
MSSDVKRALATAVVAFAALVATALPAAAQAPGAPGAPAAPGAPGAPATPSPGEKVADALRTSPVYVDAAYTDSVPPARQKQLVRQIERTGLPIKVALVPIVQGDAYDGEADAFAEVVHDRIDRADRRELVLVTGGDRWTGDLHGFEWPGEKHQARDAVGAVGFLDEMKDAGLADQTEKAIELIAEGDGTKLYEDATEHLGDGDGGSGSGGLPREDADGAGDGGSPWLLPVSVAVALALAAGALLAFVGVRRRRRGRPQRYPSATGSPFAFPQAVFAAARTADEAALRRQTEAEVLALGEAVQSADTSTPGLQGALDAYAAAGTVLDAARGLPDLAGVLALVTEGRDALDRDALDRDALDVEGSTAPPLPLCFFNPLHGRADLRIRWRPLGRREQLHVAACEECGAAVRARRAPEVLTDEGPEGRRVPYFEVPGERSVWAATGYGSLLRDADGESEGLAARVGRGDFSRGRGRGRA